MTELDFGIVFFAGHGKKIGDSFFLLPHDFIYGKRSTAIDFSSFSRRLQECPGNILVALDACRSGAVQPGEKTRAAPSDRDLEIALRLLQTRRNGLMTLSSCLPHEESLENTEWQHGAFGLALCEAFADARLYPSVMPNAVDGGGEAAARNGLLELSEIRKFVIYRVQELTTGRQHAVAYPKSIPASLDLSLAEVVDTALAP